MILYCYTAIGHISNTIIYFYPFPKAEPRKGLWDIEGKQLWVTKKPKTKTTVTQSTTTTTPTPITTTTQTTTTRIYVDDSPLLRRNQRTDEETPNEKPLISSPQRYGRFGFGGQNVRESYKKYTIPSPAPVHTERYDAPEIPGHVKPRYSYYNREVFESVLFPEEESGKINVRREFTFYISPLSGLNIVNLVSLPSFLVKHNF